ncbi:hypothetical protein [Sphingobacterium sp. SYP-B4668]|uniref:hypothetical protein n=1 Tax=Sphingobacterium sp. SYP-B4668 TaxID=2996035 RepID=UPI0022DE07B2|nr:hypothetical protein [Sphingobacterium sp. SYP-B4668]
MMHKILPCIVFIVWSCTGCALAQSEGDVYDDSFGILNFDYSLNVKSNEVLFKEQPQLDYFSVLYQDTVPYALFLYFNPSEKDSEGILKFYDLNFEGDKYLFKQEYGNKITFLAPKFNFRRIFGKAEGDIPPHVDEVWARVYRDSIVYIQRKLSTRSYQHKDYIKDTGPGVPPKYRGDLKKLGDDLSREFARSNNGERIDSILLYEATIDKLEHGDGLLIDLKLIVGNHSPFSILIENALQKTKKDWTPAFLHTGRLTKSKTKIYARLDRDGTILLQTPRMLSSRYK